MNKQLPQGYIWVWTPEALARCEEKGLERREPGKPAYYGYTPLGRSAPAVWVEKGYVDPAPDPAAFENPPAMSDSEYRGALWELRKYIVRDLLDAHRVRGHSAFVYGDGHIYKIIKKYHLPRKDAPDMTPSLDTEFVFEVFDQLIAEGRIIVKIDDDQAYYTATQKELKEARARRLQENEGLLAGMVMEERRKHFFKHHNIHPKRTGRVLLTVE